MSDNGILKVPVCINGGETVPSILDERELFLDTTKHYLYAGFSKGAVADVKVKSADISTQVSSGSVNIGGKDTTVFNVGNLMFDFSKDSLTRRDASKSYTIHKADIDALQKLVLDNNNAVYGTSLPSSGVEGQVFFKIG